MTGILLIYLSIRTLSCVYVQTLSILACHGLNTSCDSCVSNPKVSSPFVATEIYMS